METGSIPLFLDYDGVLFDSVHEAYLLTRFACTALSIHEPINIEEYRAFRSFRYLIVNSWQYRILYNLVTDCKRDIEGAYRCYVANGRQDSDCAFDAAFLSERSRMMRYEREYWLGLSEPLPFLQRVRPLFNSTMPPVIVTTKGRDAVMEGLTHHGILADASGILDKQDFAIFGDKGRLICHYMQQHAIEAAFFIDDCAENIAACRWVRGLTCLQAGWGYGAPGDETYTEQEIMAAIGIASM